MDQNKENSTKKIEVVKVERCQWLNTLISLLWPYIGENAKDFIKKHLEPTIKEKYKSFSFETIDVGQTPIQIKYIAVYAEDKLRNEIIMDLTVMYKGDCHFQVSYGIIKAGIKDFRFKGQIRVIMKPLATAMPLIGGIQIYLLDKPKIKFDATDLAGVMDIPSLKEMIRNFLSSKMALPNKSTVKILPDVPSRKIHMLQPKGVLRITAIEAKDLMVKDLLSSDPYAIITVRGEEFRTQTIHSNLNPQWNYSCENVLDVFHGLKVSIDLFDHNLIKKDKQLGSVSFSTDEILEKGTSDFWKPLERAETGQIHLQFQWFQLNTDKSQLQNILSTELRTQGCSSFVLVVYIDNAKELPLIKNDDDEFSPFVECSVGKNKFETNVSEPTNNPVWNQGFTFFLTDPSNADVSIKVFDKISDSALGHMEYQIKNLIDQKDLEINAVFPLEQSGPNSHIQLFFQLLVMTQMTEELIKQVP
ncbi:hypothetical protein CHUAL_011348 [Chamberlinius hualienensis]